LDSTSRTAQSAVGLVAAEAGDVTLVVDDGVCLSASSAFARHGGSPGGMPAPFPVAVVRAGDRYVVRLPEGRPDGAEPRTLVFDADFRPLGVFGASP